MQIKAGKLGAIYKIRLESDYTGRSPDWKCVEVQMTDINTERSLLFPVDRWFSQSKEDGSTSREVAMAKKSGDPMYPSEISLFHLCKNIVNNSNFLSNN